MFRIISRRGSVAMAAATVGLAGMSLAFAAPAGATGTVSGPNASLIVGSGSQTSYDEMTALGSLFNSAPGCDLTAATAVPLVLNCGQTPTASGTAGGEQGYNVSAENPYNDFSVEAPAIGSGNGATVLQNAGAGSATSPVDFGRASSAKGNSTVNRVKFATDAVSWTTFNKVGGVATAQAKITNMSGTDVKAIFLGTQTCTISGVTYTMDWKCEGAKVSSPIKVYMAQAGSGTYSTWSGYTGLTSNTSGAIALAGNGSSATHTNLFENQMAYISSQADAANAIYFFSLGKFTTNCPGKTSKVKHCTGTPANDFVNFGAIDGIVAAQGTVQGTGGGAGVTFPVTRGLYNMYSNSSATVPSSQAALNFVSEYGFLCKAGTGTDINAYTGNSYRFDIEAAIKAQGFFPLDVSGAPFSEGTVTYPAVLTDAAYTAIDPTTPTNGYCLVSHG